MAAHPFGPIENQLIVGYYKRGLSPTNIEAVRKSTRTLMMFDAKTHPIHFLFEPVFYGWSPANGNSSSHDFRVACSFRAITEPLDLLRRGLGYRITFTMPEQEIRTEDPTSWPLFRLEILDLTGTTVLGDTNVDVHGYFRKNFYKIKDEIRELNKYRSLQFELCCMHTKIVENGDEVFVFPVYSPPGSSIDERHLAAARRHSYLLGGYTRYPSVYSTGSGDLSFCLNQSYTAFGHLMKHHCTVTPPQKHRVGDHLLAIASNLVYFASQAEIPPTKASEQDKALLSRLMNNLESDIRKWLDDEGPFPRYVFEFNFWKYPMKSQGDLHQRPAHIPDVQGAFHPDELLRLVLRLTGIKFSDVHPYVPRSPPAVPFETKSFTICKTGTRHMFYKTSEGSATATELRDQRGKPFYGEYCLLQDLDSLLAKDPAGFWVIDLDKAHNRQWTTAGSKLSDLKTTGSSKTTLTRYGAVMCRHQGKNTLQVSILPLDPLNPSAPVVWSTQMVAMEVEATDTSKPKKYTNVPQVMLTSKALWMTAWTTDATSFVVWLGMMLRTDGGKHLQLKCQRTFLLTDNHPPTLQWLPFGRHQQIACAFTPDCRLWAFMYWRGSFVQVGSIHNKRKQFPWLGSEFSKVQTVEGAASSEGILCTRQLGVGPSGDFTCRVSRIGFAYK